MERQKKRVKLSIDNEAYLLDPAVASAVITIVKAADSSNPASAPTKRASLLGIPVELRLKIFEYLLPNDLLVIPATKRLNRSKGSASVRSCCQDFRSLMLTCRLVSSEAMEQFFENAVIKFRINHGVYHGGEGWNIGLCGFDASWSFGDDSVKPTPHIELVMRESLGAFLRNIRTLTLTVECASAESGGVYGDGSIWSVRESHSNKEAPSDSPLVTGNYNFDHDASTLLTALETAKCLETIEFIFKFDRDKVEDMTTQEVIQGVKRLLQVFIVLAHIEWELRLVDDRGRSLKLPAENRLSVFLAGLESDKKLGFLELGTVEQEITTEEEGRHDEDWPEYVGDCRL